MKAEMPLPCSLNCHMTILLPLPLLLLRPYGLVAIKKLRIRNVSRVATFFVCVAVVAVLLIRHINYCKTADWLFGNIL